MYAYLLDVTNLLVRWLHVVAAIAWIGESIYFVMLDNSLRPPRKGARTQDGVFGEMWAVHGGGFYHNQKYLTRPAELPENLHWSKWKAYTTWLSGFALFTVLYLTKPDFYLVNPSSPWAWAATLTGMQAGALAVAYLILGWFAYDQLCRRISPDTRHDGVLGIAIAIMIGIVAWSTTQIFQGRAAFLITGAVMATAMSANVFFWIIPGQRRMVAALREGRPVDPLDGARGKQRSMHNTYFTLPVVLLMLSNHYSFTYTSPHSWIIMSLLIVSGALIRQYFVLRHADQHRPGLPAAGVILILAALWLAAPTAPGPYPVTDAADTVAAPETASTALQDVQRIVMARCIQCHAAQPSMAGFSAPPLGLSFETPQQITTHAEQIKQTVANNYMPLGNITNMTMPEREIIRIWKP